MSFHIDVCGTNFTSWLHPVQYKIVLSTKNNGLSVQELNDQHHVDYIVQTCLSPVVDITPYVDATDRSDRIFSPLAPWLRPEYTVTVDAGKQVQFRIPGNKVGYVMRVSRPQDVHSCSHSRALSRGSLLTVDLIPFMVADRDRTPGRV